MEMQRRSVGIVDWAFGVATENVASKLSEVNAEHKPPGGVYR